ncbi:conserved exported hypothetical protein [Planktothrix serta PCC 8927]|uniref:Uncharacterized protein n=1 Tax=Planktothrix serta PCC 8927 TaxID=671068 RepID=A0A7Z9DYL6_9CYAN|nr:hypothetical protein [Planktothrix serta]VXD18318.1 conserved exported hypothetical protein [Planktothrix serta PCC 8927]
MPLELIILLASLLVAWLVFTWAVQVLKASISTAVAIAAIVLILQLVFGIGPQELLDHLIQLPQTLWNLILNSRSSGGN